MSRYFGGTHLPSLYEPDGTPFYAPRTLRPHLVNTDDARGCSAGHHSKPVKLIGPSRGHPDATGWLLDQERVWQSRASAAPASSSSRLSRAFGAGYRCGYDTRTTTRNYAAQCRARGSTQIRGDIRAGRFLAPTHTGAASPFSADDSHSGSPLCCCVGNADVEVSSTGSATMALPRYAVGKTFHTRRGAIGLSTPLEKRLSVRRYLNPIELPAQSPCIRPRCQNRPLSCRTTCAAKWRAFTRKRPRLSSPNAS